MAILAPNRQLGNGFGKKKRVSRPLEEDFMGETLECGPAARIPGSEVWSNRTTRYPVGKGLTSTQPLYHLAVVFAYVPLWKHVICELTLFGGFFGFLFLNKQ